MKSEFLVLIAFLVAAEHSFAYCNPGEDGYIANGAREVGTANIAASESLIEVSTESGIRVFASQTDFLEIVDRNLRHGVRRMEELAGWIRSQAMGPPILLNEFEDPKYLSISVIFLDLAQDGKLLLRSDVSGHVVTDAVIEGYSCFGSGGRTLRTSGGLPIISAMERIQ